MRGPTETCTRGASGLFRRDRPANLHVEGPLRTWTGDQWVAQPYDLPCGSGCCSFGLGDRGGGAGGASLVFGTVEIGLLRGLIFKTEWSVQFWRKGEAIGQKAVCCNFLMKIYYDRKLQNEKFVVSSISNEIIYSYFK